ncbi:MAG: DUF4453 domain-containing protein [Pseudomonadota bacterium]
MFAHRGGKPSLILALLLIPQALMAEPICDDLWFSRNFYFDRAGFCFSSVLGEEVFDNADCTTDVPALSIDEKAVIADIQAQEGHLGCSTHIQERRELEITLLPERRRLLDQPIRSEFESACVGFLGSELMLFSGRDETGEEIGTIEKGDTILLYHAVPNQKGTRDTFVSGVFRNQEMMPILGWTNFVLREEDCAQVAG